MPADTFDSEFRAQFEEGGQNPAQMFASGYFPESYGEPQVDCGRSNGPIALVGETEQEWYPRQWRAAREPSFYLMAGQETSPEFALRFSYIPSFTPSVFIRVQSDGDGLRLIAKVMSGAGGYDPGTINRSREVRLSSEQAAELRRILAEGELFSEAPDSCPFGFDGSKWIFEVIDIHEYKMVKRWSPNSGAGFDLGQHLLRLSGWDVDTY